MKKTLGLTALLITGLIFSQLLPVLIGKLPSWFDFGRHFITMSLLAFIMIEVGQHFDVDLKNKKQYAFDYLVAATAATFPWIFVSLYFLFILMPSSTTIQPRWVEAFLVGRFAAPTSAGVLFSMLAASGLSDTWVFKKTRILAIFDDLDTVLLMVPLQMLIVGFVWQLGGAFIATGTMLYVGFKFYRKIKMPSTWPWVLSYSFLWVMISEWLVAVTKTPASPSGMHIEVLLPAFVLGCTLNRPNKEDSFISEKKASEIVAGVFMFFVGVSMPAAFGPEALVQSSMNSMTLGFHVLMITFLSNLGKMFACLCYRKEASFKERLAVSVAMFPRGEVGAGILAMSLSYGVIGPHITIAFMSLALNLVLTGAFIFVVKRLLITEDPLHE